MNIKQLREAIAELPDEMEVILRKDAEGNDHSPLSDFSPDYVYVAETTWSGDVYCIENTAEDNCMEDEEWNELKSLPRVLLLCPVN